MITVSVPAKVHLMGEHAIVHGKPALLAAINRRMMVSVFPAPSLSIETTQSDTCVLQALAVLQREYKLDHLPPMKITISSQFPAGYHLGSSAAVAVGVVAAVTYFLKKVWNPVAINQLAYEVEKSMHGNPSGGDNTTVTFGGFIWYRKELEFLKSIWQVPMKLPEKLNHFFLVDTGRPVETTGEMVAYVDTKCKMQSAKFEQLFAQNERQTKRIAQAIKDGNGLDFLEALKRGEQTLEAMGVVSRKAIGMIRTIEKAGGATKILGGGGRKSGVGFLLAYHPQPEIFLGLAKKYKYAVEPIQLGEEGIRLESKS